MPCESSLAGRSATGVSPRPSSISSSAASIAVDPAVRGGLADRDVLADGEVVVELDRLEGATEPEARPRVGPQALQRRRRRGGRRPSAGAAPVTASSSVVLPAPFGPMSPVIDPCAHVEAHVRDRGDAAVADGEVADREHDVARRRARRVDDRVGIGDRRRRGHRRLALQPAGVELLVERADDALGVGDDRVDHPETRDHRVPRAEVDVVVRRTVTRTPSMARTPATIAPDTDVMPARYAVANRLSPRYTLNDATVTLPCL